MGPDFQQVGEIHLPDSFVAGHMHERACLGERQGASFQALSKGAPHQAGNIADRKAEALGLRLDGCFAGGISKHTLL